MGACLLLPSGYRFDLGISNDATKIFYSIICLWIAETYGYQVQAGTDGMQPASAPLRADEGRHRCLLDLANAIIAVRSLIRQAWVTYRRDTALMVMITSPIRAASRRLYPPAVAAA